MACFWLELLCRLMKIQLLIPERQSVTLPSIRLEDFVLHAQSRGIELDSLLHVLGCKHNMVNRLDREGSHRSVIEIDFASGKSAEAAMTESQHCLLARESCDVDVVTSFSPRSLSRLDARGQTRRFQPLRHSAPPINLLNHNDIIFPAQLHIISCITLSVFSNF